MMNLACLLSEQFRASGPSCLAHLAQRAIVSYCHTNVSGMHHLTTNTQTSSIKLLDLQFSNFTWSE